MVCRLRGTFRAAIIHLQVNGAWIVQIVGIKHKEQVNSFFLSGFKARPCSSQPLVLNYPDYSSNLLHNAVEGL